MLIAGDGDVYSKLDAAGRLELTFELSPEWQEGVNPWEMQGQYVPGEGTASAGLLRKRVWYRQTWLGRSECG